MNNPGDFTPNIKDDSIKAIQTGASALCMGVGITAAIIAIAVGFFILCFFISIGLTFL